MPEHRFESADDEPLFTDDDPLTISVPDKAGKFVKFRCLDRANPPLERDDTDPEKRPVSYLVELLKLQVIPEEQDDFEDALIEAIAANRIMVPKLIEVARWLGEQRAEAEKGAVSRTVARPTRARRASTR